MRLAQRSIKRLWLISSILILVLFFSIAFSPILLPHLSTKTHPTLPGQQRWKQGVSSFITRFTIDALHSMAQAGVAFACQFDAASYSGYGHLDMFQVDTAQPKPQFYAIKDLIQQYRPVSIT